MVDREEVKSVIPYFPLSIASSSKILASLKMELKIYISATAQSEMSVAVGV